MVTDEKFIEDSWKVEAANRDGYWIVSDKNVVIVGGGDEEWGLGSILEKRNAHLISEAPNMYRQLNRMCHNSLDLGHCHMTDCHTCPTMAVLKKARGEE